MDTCSTVEESTGKAPECSGILVENPEVSVAKVALLNTNTKTPRLEWSEKAKSEVSLGQVKSLIRVGTNFLVERNKTLGLALNGPKMTTSSEASQNPKGALRLKDWYENINDQI